MRPAATAARPRLDPASVEILREALAQPDWSTRLLVVELLGEAGEEAFLPWLEHALGDPETDVRAAAVEALARIGSFRALAQLTTVRDDAEEEIAIRALAAASLLRTAGAAPRMPRAERTKKP